ncbi:MAG: NitT/TauT family transport system substrate-binding protein [Blastocatellia bacterium]
MNRKSLIIIIAAIIGILVGGILVWRGKNKDNGIKQPTQASVRLAWIPGATFTGDYVALQKGFWKEEGLEVSLNPGGFEQDAIKLVAAGADTFGITSGPQLLQARASGVPIVAIGAVIPRSPIGWIAKKESGIKTPQNFVGKKIGAQFGTHTEITLEALCAKLGIALDSFKRIPVKFDPLPFIAGEIDVLPVYIIDQPVDLRKQGMELNIIDPHDYGVSLAFGNLYFTTEETLKNRPEMVKAFLRGAKRGWLLANDNPNQAVDILNGYVADADKTVLLAKLNAILDFIKKERPTYLGVFPMDIAQWQSTNEILVRHGNLRPDLNLTDCFTNDYLREK